MASASEDKAVLGLLKATVDLLEVSEKSLEDFGRRVRGLTSGLWRGTITEFEFVDSMFDVLRRGYTQAWNEGAAACGVLPEEFTEAERAELQQAINQDSTHLPDFARSIVENSREEEGLLGGRMLRAELWTNGYNRVQARSQQIACADQKLMWVWNPLKEHCEDCRHLNGRVYRASTWQKNGIQPQGNNLACGGFRCGCRFVVTTERGSGGRPSLVGS